MNKASQIRNWGGKKHMQLTRVLVGLAVVMFVVSGWAWWHQVRSNPERVFYGAIENSLRTVSVTRRAAYDSSEQTAEIAVSPSLKSHALTTQSTDTGQGKTVVQTESISTADSEYVRWVRIDTDQKDTKGEQLKFDDLLNIWGKSTTEQDGQLSQLYMSLLSGIVPTANFNVHDRQELMKLVRDEKVYSFDASKVERTIHNGRPVYNYQVEVSPMAFYKFIQKYGTIANIQQLKDIDPAQLQGAPSETFGLTIDVWGRHIVALTDPNGVTEALGGYGIIHDITVPKESIPLEELQAKLQAVQE